MNPRNRNHQRNRRGSVYVLVVGTAMLVSLLTLATLTAQLIRHRQSVSLADSLQAMTNAEAGIRYGLQQLDADSTWRSTLPNGTWATQSTGDGWFELQGLDLGDSSLSDEPLDPLTLVALGTHRDATHKLQTTIIPSRKPYDCLEVGICAGNDIRCDAAHLHYYGTIAANNTINAEGGSVIWPDCEASNKVNGTGYQRATVESVAERTLPSASELVTYYADLAETIDRAELPIQTPNLFRDPSFEQGIGLWSKSWDSGHAAEVAINTNEANTGAASLSVTARTSATDGPTYDLTHVAKPGATYEISGWVKLAAAGHVRVTLNAISTEGEDATASDYASVGTDWVQVSFTMDAPTWTGDLEQLNLRVETDPNDSTPESEILIDDVSIVELGSTKRLTHVAIGPDTNPFGDGSPNGVYVIDCQNSDLLIEHSRIVGTLVILNPGEVVIGPGPVHWTASRPGFPTLIVDGDVSISSENRALSEFKLATNFNPNEMPFAKIGSNSSETESYPSEFSGILFSSGDFRVSGQIGFRNARIVASNDVVFESQTRFTTHGLAQEIGPKLFHYRYQIFNGSMR